jgi:hypothetical protein
LPEAIQDTSGNTKSVFTFFFKTNAFKGDQRLFGFSSKKIIQFRDAIEQKWSGRQVLVRKGQIRISSEVLGT